MAADDLLENVSDTALWVAYYRAEESERKDALFRDPYVKRLAGERGRRIAAAMGSTARYTRDLRTSVKFQSWIAEYFAREVYPHLNNRDRLKRMKNAPFLFLPDDWFGFFRAQGWVERETRFIGEETPKQGRKAPVPWWAYLFLIFAPEARRKILRRMTGYTLFRPA